jgi:signal transduction histidine kinase
MRATNSLLNRKFIRLLIVGITFLRYPRDLMLAFWHFIFENVAPFQRKYWVGLAKFDQSFDALNGVPAFNHSSRPDQALRIRRTKSLRLKKHPALASQKAVSEVTICVMHDVTNTLSAMSLLSLRAKQDLQTISAKAILPGFITAMDNITNTLTKIIKTHQMSALGLGDIWDTVTVDQVLQDAMALEIYGLQNSAIELTIRGVVGTRVVTRRSALMSVIVNCIKNAREALALSRCDHPAISIDVSRSGYDVIIAIKDNGIGATAETLEKLKVRGFTSKADGHGIGLFGSRKNMVALGGSLEVKSEGLGLGATSIIRQPIDAETFHSLAKVILRQS